SMTWTTILSRPHHQAPHFRCGSSSKGRVFGATDRPPDTGALATLHWRGGQVRRRGWHAFDPVDSSRGCSPSALFSHLQEDRDERAVPCAFLATRPCRVLLR